MWEKEKSLLGNLKMISTDFLAGQGLGNQLWVYAACRGIATNLQLPYMIGGLEHFKGKNFLEIDAGSSDVQVAHNKTASDSSNKKLQERLFYDPCLKYFASDYDSRVERLGANTHLEGLFQSEKYFYGRESELGQWIRLSEEMNEKSLQYAGICVVNIRGGEYKRHKNLILPKSYWASAIKNIRQSKGFDKFLIVTDDRAYARKLLPDYPILEGGIAECFAALYGAGCLIVSNSSFSYFPIKMRLDKPHVIAPYLWSRPSNFLLRWAAPANFYKDWHWQDVEGNIHSYEDCKTLVDRTMETYSMHYSVSIPPEYIKQKALINIMPKRMKRSLKRILSKLFPLHIG